MDIGEAKNSCRDLSYLHLQEQNIRTGGMEPVFLINKKLQTMVPFHCVNFSNASSI